MTVDTTHRASPLRRNDPQRLGPYLLIGRLGSGGMGVVYLGRRADGLLVAVKLVHAHLAGDDEFRRRFRSEIARARQVPPFCTAEVLDADLDHEHPYLVVEYVDGPSLADVVEARGPLSPANLHSVAIGVATALTAIHGAGVIHRDLKPRNVLLAPGSPKVIDFGIARALEPTSQHTRTDQMVGTVGYMAPERFDSEPGTPLTPAADVFAWGVVVAYAGTGRTPFNGDSPPATAARILTQPPQLDGLTGPLRHLVELALAKNPADRPTARELLDLLLADQPQLTPPLAEALERQPALQSAASGAQDLTGGTGERAAAAVPRQRDRADAAPTTDGLDRDRHDRAAAAAPTGYVGGFPPVPPVRPPDGVPGHRPAHARRRSRWRIVLIGLLVLTVLLAGTAVAGLMLVELGSGLSPANPSAEVEDEPGPTDVGVSMISDPLNEPGQWSDSEITEDGSSCVIDGVMRARQKNRGIYQCTGPEKDVPPDSSVDVTTTLETDGSCAAIWLRWNGDAGYQVRLCADAVHVAIDRPEDKRILQSMPLNEPIVVDQPTTLRVVVWNQTVEVLVDGVSVGSTELTEVDLAEGQVLLGMSVDSVTARPPFAVSFANVDIRSLAD